MVNGFIKTAIVLVCFWCMSAMAYAEYMVTADVLTHDIKDLSERNSKVLDQNGERCALIKFETIIPEMFSFNLGAQQIEKRVNKEDEIWLWVSADVKKMTIRCTDCTPLKDYRVSLKPGNVYRVKLTTGMPIETTTTQFLNLYCDQTPYQVSIDGGAPVTQNARTYHVELPIGSHTYTVSSRFFRDYAGEVKLERSHAFSDTISLERNYGELTVLANMSNYEVLIDGEARIYSQAYRVEPGIHYVTVTKSKYETVQDTVMINLGQRTSLPVRFVPSFTVVTIMAREPKTEIWVDDELRGHDKVSVEVLYGTHKIEGRREGYDTWEYPVHEFTKTSERNITIPRLNQQFGSIRIAVFPPEARLYLDGTPVETNNGVFVSRQLPVGLHFAYASMTDYHSVRDSIVVEPSKVSTREYHMEHIPLGTISLQTDPKIAIFALGEDTVFYGTQTFSGKLPAGENIIMLKNTNGDCCFHHIFVAEGVINPSVTLPFYRKVMFRSNVSLKNISMRNNNRQFSVQLNKKMSLPPLMYTLKASKKGYQEYVDSLDLSKSDVKNLIHQINMRKIGDNSVETNSIEDASVRSRFYSKAGRWFIGVLNVGYTYSFADSAHIVSLGALSFRYKMFGMSLLNFDLPVTGSHKRNVYYNPKMSLIVPFSAGGAFTFYGGLNVNATIWNQNRQGKSLQLVPIYARGGVSLLVNGSGKVPVEFFCEYRAPIKNDNTAYNKAKLFRVGINFAFGVDK